MQAVADYCGPTDFIDDLGVTGAKTDAPVLVKLFGGTSKEKADAWKQGSPITFVRAGDPPFLIVHGDADKTVPIEHSKRFSAALKKSDVPVEFIVVKGGGHGMTAAKGEPPAEPDANALNAAVLAFFDKQLKK